MIIIGHRGAAGYRAENSLESFAYAINLGVDMIELDVYACATGELFVIHDDDVSLTTNGQGTITDMNFDQVFQLRLSNGERVPQLQEVFDLVKSRVPINIELKGPATAEKVAKVIKDYLKKGFQKKDFIISSFDLNQIAQFKKICPDVLIGLLFEADQIPNDLIAILKKYKAEFVGLDFISITSDLVHSLHQQNIVVYAWTVNDIVIAGTMKKYGVDGIFSDYPDRVKN